MNIYLLIKLFCILWSVLWIATLVFTIRSMLHYKMDSGEMINRLFLILITAGLAFPFVQPSKYEDDDQS